MQPRVRTETAPSDLSQAAVPKYVRGCGFISRGLVTRSGVLCGEANTVVISLVSEEKGSVVG
jgi:hypothetical protein